MKIQLIIHTPHTLTYTHTNRLRKILRKLKDPVGVSHVLTVFIPTVYILMVIANSLNVWGYYNDSMCKTAGTVTTNLYLTAKHSLYLLFVARIQVVVI